MWLAEYLAAYAEISSSAHPVYFAEGSIEEYYRSVN
jgi:hypothetical protein